MDWLWIQFTTKKREKLNFVNHGRFLYCGVRPRAQLHQTSDQSRESNVHRFPELWWPAPATVDTAESRLTSGDTSSGHKPGFPAKTYAHQVTHPPCIVFSPTLLYLTLYWLVCFGATATFDRKHINEDLMKWHTGCPEEKSTLKRWWCYHYFFNTLARWEKKDWSWCRRIILLIKSRLFSGTPCTCPEVVHVWIKHLIWATKYGVEFWIRLYITLNANITRVIFK